jgi:hypothetical protein
MRTEAALLTLSLVAALVGVVEVVVSLVEALVEEEEADVL